MRVKLLSFSGGIKYKIFYVYESFDRNNNKFKLFPYAKNKIISSEISFEDKFRVPFERERKLNR